MRQTQRAAAAARYPGKYLLRKYPNRRIYDCKRSCYITLVDVLTLVSQGKDVMVMDYQNNDVTRECLFATLGVCEEHSREPVLKVETLREMVRTSVSNIPASTIERLQNTKKTNHTSGAAAS